MYDVCAYIYYSIELYVLISNYSIDNYIVIYVPIIKVHLQELVYD